MILLQRQVVGVVDNDKRILGVRPDVGILEGDGERVRRVRFNTIIARLHGKFIFVMILVEHSVQGGNAHEGMVAMGVDHSDVVAGNEFERDHVLFGESYGRLANTLGLDVVDADGRSFFGKDSVHTDLHVIVLGQTGRDLEIHGFVGVLATFVLVVD